MGRLLDIKEVAGRLGVDEQTVRGWRKRKTGPPAFLVVGNLRWDEDELNAWVASQRETTIDAVVSGQ